MVEKIVWTDGEFEVVDTGKQYLVRGPNHFLRAVCSADALSSIGHIGFDFCAATRAVEEYENSKRREKFGARLDKAQPCFVRFGELPAGGRSRDHRSGQLEAGVCVYQALHDDIGYILDLRGTDAASAMFIIGMAQAYEISGVVNGRASDGTPTLADARIVRTIKQRIEILT